MAPLLIGFGGALMIVSAVLLLRRPDWVDWLNDHTNGISARRWARWPRFAWSIEKYERQKPLLRKLLPLWLVLIGSAWLGWGVYHLVT